MSAGETRRAVLDRSRPPFTTGDIVARKYRIEEVLGCGGMAWVLRARHLKLNQRVALKVLRFEPTPESVARFFQEGRAAARVSSESVTRVLDVDTLADGSPYLVMEYLDGYDLEQVVSEPELLPTTTAVDIVIQGCEGLAEVHAAGIVHRDLKPSNLFLARKGDGYVRVKLLDFGISKFAAGQRFTGGDLPTTETSPEALMGSPVYMAPEQMLSTKDVDGRADIWSMGVILYELLSGGRSPFAAETLPEVCTRVLRGTPESLETLRADLPPGLEAVVARCLEKLPERRFVTAASLAIALAPYASRDGALLARRMQHRRTAMRPSHAPPPRRMPTPTRPALPVLPAGRPLPETPPWRRSPPPVPRTGTIALFERPSLVHGAPSNPPSWVPAPSAVRARLPSTPTSPTSFSVPLPRSDRRAAWAAIAVSTLVTLMAAAVFALPARPLAGHRAVGLEPAMGVASPMPHADSSASPAPSAPLLSAATAAAGPIVVESTHLEPLASTPHVYTPDELPIATPLPAPTVAVTPKNLGAHPKAERTPSIHPSARRDVPDGF